MTRSSRALIAGAPRSSYFSAGLEKMKDFKKRYGAMGIDAVNSLAPKHEITLEQDEATDYASCAIADGRLRIIFNAAQFGSWYSGALGDLPEACDKASVPVDGPYSFLARFSVHDEYEQQVEAVRKDVAEILAVPDIKLNPRFEENAAVLSNAEGVRDWKSSWGRRLLKIMKAAAQGLKDAGFKGDDMMQEAIQEALTQKEMAIHVDPETSLSSWNDVALKDGVILLKVWHSVSIVASLIHCLCKVRARVLQHNDHQQYEQARGSTLKWLIARCDRFPRRSTNL